MLKLSDVSFSYGKSPALHHISCKVETGELVGIIGKNGSGKTTLLRIAAAHLTPSGGTCSLSDREILTIPRKTLAKSLAYFPQIRPTPDLTVSEYVALGRYPHKSPLSPLSPADRSVVQEALTTTNTADLANRPVASLSGGERQRVYLALLLAQEAKYLLLDEPTAHLDIGQAYDVLNTLQSLAKSGHAILAVLHDIAPALTYCDRLLLMDDGKLIADLTPQELVESGLLKQSLGVRAIALKEGYAILPQ